MTVSCPLPSGRDCIADAGDWKSFVEVLRRQWRLLWRERIADKVRAEGIASKDFELLFLDRGTVIAATRFFKAPDFRKILEEYEAPYEVKVKQETPAPSVGGWRKFGREIAASQRKKRKGRRGMWPINGRINGQKGNQPLKKGGRGWLHFHSK
jgi:hypothetical protein